MDVNKEIEILRQQLKNINFKLQMIEKAANKETSPEQKQNPPAIAPHAKTIIKEIPEPIQTSKPNNSLENIFGQYWLNRIGVIVFVIGIGFFINYTFQSFGAWIKILMGFALTLGFFIWGKYLEKIPEYQKLSWGISGGAWGLLYLTTYAMYYFKATRVITNAPLETILLMIISLIAIIYNLKYRSWVVTSMTYFLAFISASLGGFDFSSIIYFSFLVASIVFLSYKLKWYPFLLYGVIGSYLTYTSFSFTHQLYDFTIIFSILTMTWLLFSMSTHWMEVDTPQRLKMNITVLSLNALMYLSLGLHQINIVKHQFNFNLSGWFLFLLGVAYLLKNITHRNLKRTNLYPATIAITTLIFGIWFLSEFPAQNVSLYWALEMTTLLILGIYYQSRIYKVLGAGLGLLVILRFFMYDFYLKSDVFCQTLPLHINHNIFTGSSIAILLYILAIWHSAHTKKNLHTADDWQNIYYWGLPSMATIIIFALLGDCIPTRWISVAWTIQAVAVFAIGLVSNSKAFRMIALAIICIILLRVITYDIMGLATIYKIITFICLGIILMSMSLIYSKFIKNSKD